MAQPQPPSPNVYFCRSLLGLVPAFVPSYMRKCFTKRIESWHLSPDSSIHPQGTPLEAELGAAYYLRSVKGTLIRRSTIPAWLDWKQAAYYLRRTSALRAYRLASNHITFDPCAGLSNQTLTVRQKPPSRGRIHLSLRAAPLLDRVK